MELPKSIKNIINEENRTKMIGLLTILIMLWLVLYLIPDVLTSLLYTLLGNLILVATVLLISMYNIRYGLFIGLILIILYRLVRIKEGFTWSENSTQDFLKIQNTINHNTIFDVDMIQANQASQEELDYFNKNGMWPWSQKTIELYKKAVNSNPFIRTYSGDAVNYTRTKYNESAVLRIMSYQTKEGQFLLNGVLVTNPSGNPYEDLPNGFGDFAYESGLLDNRSDDIIKCNMKQSNNATLERITYTGKGGIFGEQTNKVTPVDYNDLDKIIPGFTFVNGPCNPCGALNENPDYSCPFNLDVKKNSFISNVWQHLWNINT
jgi:hypothetical protein